MATRKARLPARSDLARRARQENTLINFKKAQSLVTKIIKMVESNEYCIDIMQQNLAAIGLLKSAHQMLMENHLSTCFRKAVETPKKNKLSAGQAKSEKRKQEMIQEILKVTKMANK